LRDKTLSGTAFFHLSRYNDNFLSTLRIRADATVIRRIGGIATIETVEANLDIGKDLPRTRQPIALKENGLLRGLSSAHDYLGFWFSFADYTIRIVKNASRRYP
jgi:hypothetical protein